jgi:hypothetical protein
MDTERRCLIRTASSLVRFQLCRVSTIGSRILVGLAVNAELQNDPDDDAVDDQTTITAHTVRTRMSGLRRSELPKEESVKIVAGLDIGKYWSHWVKIAMYGNAVGTSLIMA